MALYNDSDIADINFRIDETNGFISNAINLARLMGYNSCKEAQMDSLLRNWLINRMACFVLLEQINNGDI